MGTWEGEEGGAVDDGEGEVEVEREGYMGGEWVIGVGEGVGIYWGHFAVLI